MLYSRTKFCSFCTSAGIAGPHDHYLRVSSSLNSAICCPVLLQTQCTHCHRFGHIAKYCGERLEEIKITKKTTKNAEQDMMERGEAWSKPVQSGRSCGGGCRPISPNKITNKLASRFAALEMSDDSNEESDIEEFKPTNDTKSWSMIVKDPIRSELDLPDLKTIVFGSKTSRWSDED